MKDYQMEFAKILHKRFEQTFPDTFVKSNTLDQGVWESANRSMYTWYLTILNSFNVYSLEGKYKRTREDIINNVNHVEGFLKDLEETKHWIKFIVEYLPSKY